MLRVRAHGLKLHVLCVDALISRQRDVLPDSGDHDVAIVGPIWIAISNDSNGREHTLEFQPESSSPEHEVIRMDVRTAEQGHERAQISLGNMYYGGVGVAEDDAEAVRWYRWAAEQREADAQFMLGVMHAKGEGVPEDNVDAARWYRLAAEQGQARAQWNLGLMYARGEGVPVDAVNAYAWTNIAAAQGIGTNAKEVKEALTNDMTRAQIAEAQKLSRDYWAR